MNRKMPNIDNMAIRIATAASGAQNKDEQMRILTDELRQCLEPFYATIARLDRADSQWRELYAVRSDEAKELAAQVIMLTEELAETKLLAAAASITNTDESKTSENPCQCIEPPACYERWPDDPDSWCCKPPWRKKEEQMLFRDDGRTIVCPGDGAHYTHEEDSCGPCHDEVNGRI